MKPRMMRRSAKIRVEVEQGPVDLPAECVNLSPSGMAFELEEPLMVGDKFRLLIYLPVGKELELIRASGEAVRTEPAAEDPSKTRVGASFNSFAPGDERRLKRWLLDNPSYPPPDTSAR